MPRHDMRGRGLASNAQRSVSSLFHWMKHQQVVRPAAARLTTSEGREDELRRHPLDGA